MGLPLKGDPHRELAVAIRYLWGISIFLTSMQLWAALDVARRQGLWASGPELGIISAIYLLPGCLYVVCAIYANRGSRRALKGAAFLACLQLLGIGAEIVLGIIMAITNRRIHWLDVGIMTLLALAGAVLVWFIAILERASRAILYMTDDGVRGFEPLINTPNPESNTLPRSQD